MTALPPNGQQPADQAAAVSGLAREVEALRRRLDDVVSLPRKHRDLARVVQGLAEQVKAMRPATGSSGDSACRTWLAAPVGVDAAEMVLGELVEWVAAVFLRYADARKVLPECWLWHPDVVEELLWLMTAWQSAYAGETATVFQAADWHDRYRPGVIRRIPLLARNCSIEKHTQPAATGEQPVMDETTREQIAVWWGGSDPRGPAPVPTADQLDNSRGEHDR